MHFPIVCRILGLLLMLFSILANLPSILVSLIYSDGEIRSFSMALLVTFVTGLTLWFLTIGAKKELRTRDGFLVVTLFWTVLGTFGALPFFFSADLPLSITDAVFESFSGLSTTGATVIVGLDSLPKSILFYRQQLQWLGGMGIIALAVAVLPMLGIGGMQLYRAESPGPVKNDNLVPRLAETAKALWYIYLALTLACTLCFWAAGMTFFDAICHSFTTIAIGGFSTHDASLGFFDSPLINMIATVFMFLAGINFALHFTAWRSKSVTQYLRDPELQFYSVMMVVLVLVTVSVLYFTQTYSLFDSVIHGSTGGGMKVIRILLILKQGLREIQRLIHPSAVIPIKLGSTLVPDKVIDSVWGFFAMYVMVFLALLLAMLATGMDVITAFSAVGAAINNLGPGLEGVAKNYSMVTDTGKWILCFAMLLGRLEIFTLLVLFLPMFWRR